MSIPHRFDPTTTAAAIRAEHDSIDDGTETGVMVTIAGRLMLRRGEGKKGLGPPPNLTSSARKPEWF